MDLQLSPSAQSPGEENGQNFALYKLLVSIKTNRKKNCTANISLWPEEELG